MLDSKATLTLSLPDVQWTYFNIQRTTVKRWKIFRQPAMFHCTFFHPFLHLLRQVLLSQMSRSRVTILHNLFYADIRLMQNAAARLSSLFLRLMSGLFSQPPLPLLSVRVFASEWRDKWSKPIWWKYCLALKVCVMRRDAVSTSFVSQIFQPLLIDRREKLSHY